jgi:flagellar hook-associated protein 1 FlgK
MSLTMALNNALTGLRVNQQALALTSHNLANAHTEGYSRQQLETSASYAGGQLNGVRIEDVVRRVDTYLQGSIRLYSSHTGRTEAMAEYSDRMQIMLGEPGAENSIDEYTENFFNALQSLAETPERTSFREAAVNAGTTLAKEVSALAGDLEKMRYDIDRDLFNTVTEVNNLIEGISSLNIAVNNAKALGNPTAGLEDERDLMLEELSSYLEIRTYTLDTGEVHVYTNNGVAMLDDTVYNLRYDSAASTETFINDMELNPLEVVVYDENNRIVGRQNNLISAGVDGGDITTVLKQGRFEGLRQMRDEVIPATLAQLDELATTIRDAFNAIHNDGSAFPGSSELTASRIMSTGDKTEWSGSVMIAALKDDGTPAPSVYKDESHTGFRPLELDLSSLDSGFGVGYPTTQTIIDEINSHFNGPPLKTTLGNLNNIQMVSDVSAMPDVPPIFSFDFDLENISSLPADFFVTGFTVLDDTGADITNINTPPPQQALDATNTYTTTAGSSIVTVRSTGHSLSEGQRIFIPEPGVAVNGIPSSAFGTFVEVRNVTNNGFDIDLGAAGSASSSGAVSVASQAATLNWDTIEPGENRRIRDSGVVELNLSGNSGSSYYEITVDVAVDDLQGTAGSSSTAQLTFRIDNNSAGLLNKRYTSIAETGEAERIPPVTSQSYLKAIMVDDNGVELPKNNGIYTTNRQGYLKLVAADGYTVSIDQMDSKQLGVITYNPATAGTNRGFSHYFGLNNFFSSNGQTDTGEVLTGSAINLAIEERFLGNSNLISLGKLTPSNQPPGENAKPVYTYERYIADNSLIQQLAKLGVTDIHFDPAGGMDSSTQQINGYIGEILAFNAASAVQTANENENAHTLLDGFIERSDSFSGVNVDEELANTVIYQQAYTASARIISTANEMFDTLLNAF